jgi:hypothetical protein
LTPVHSFCFPLPTFPSSCSGMKPFGAAANDSPSMPPLGPNSRGRTVALVCIFGNNLRSEFSAPDQKIQRLPSTSRIAPTVTIRYTVSSVTGRRRTVWGCGSFCGLDAARGRDCIVRLPFFASEREGHWLRLNIGTEPATGGSASISVRRRFFLRDAGIFREINLCLLHRPDRKKP